MTEERAARLFMARLAPEVTTKARRTRSRFQRRLADNIRDALESTGKPYTLDPQWSRIFVRFQDEAAPDVLSRVFGLSSISPVEGVVDSDLPSIVEEGRRLFSDRVKGKRYAVQARRRGRHPFTSNDVHVELGAALNPGAEVDLDDPEVAVEVDIGPEKTYLFSERIPGAGGLPVGTEGRALVLISGGYDSALAAALMLKRGAEVDYVFCNLGGGAYERAVLQVTKVLADEWSYGSRPRFHAVDFADVVQALRSDVSPGYVQVVLKRLMVRTACRVAEEIGAEAVVTGEAMGQVSSQTLTNLRAIEPAADRPILRPLVGFDKKEIIERTRELGTAALSEKVKEYCGLTQAKPVTAARVEAVDREEGKLDPTLLGTALEGRAVHDLHTLTPTDLVAPYLFTEEVPEDAVVLDCRPVEQYRHWHYPGAEHRDEWRLMERFGEEDRDRTYVLYCAQGMKTAYIAERMQREGYEAYSFRGGVRRLLEQANGAR